MFGIRFTGVFSYADGDYGRSRAIWLSVVIRVHAMRANRQRHSNHTVMISALLLIASVASADPVRADTLRPDAEIREVVLRHASEVQRCYEMEGLSRNSTLSGTIEVELRILPVGRVDSVQVLKSGAAAAGMKEVSECIATIVRNWRFARGPYSVEQVILPFSLKPLPPAPGSSRAAAGAPGASLAIPTP